jgi:SAM-dependent methyltransferase
MPLEANGPNAEQIKYWNETAGPKWVALQGFIDQQIRPLGRLTMERAGVAPGERVLDVGCGCGDTTVELARRVGPQGTVLGLDISTAMLERAREAARGAAVSNARFENADAQTVALPRAAFDVLYSRFGVMFFTDPPRAFANLRAALSPGARLAFVCWRALPENPWMMIPLMAAVQHLQLGPPPAPDAPGPFAFADAERVRGILAAAGFAGIAFEQVDETLTVGGKTSLEETVDFLLQMGPTGAALRQEGPEKRDQVAAAVRDAVRPYHGPEGLRMASSAWIVTARNR